MSRSHSDHTLLAIIFLMLLDWYLAKTFSYILLLVATFDSRLYTLSLITLFAALLVKYDWPRATVSQYGLELWVSEFRQSHTICEYDYHTIEIVHSNPIIV